MSPLQPRHLAVVSTPSREDLAVGNVDDGAGSSAWWWLHPVVADPTRPALLDSDGLQWSRQEVVDAVRTVAASLSARGVGRHDRLALVMPPGPELACALLGAMSTAVVAPLAPSSPVGNLADSFQRLHITGVLVDGDPPQAVAEAAARTGVAVIPLNPLRLSAADAPDPVRPEPDDLALLLQTSGTTARPKVVPLTHANLQASTRWAAESMELGTDDRGLLAMPLHHISGIVTSLLAPLMAGGSVICCRSSGPDVLRNVLGGLHPTWFSAVPTLLQALLTQAERSVGSESHSLRFIRAAGSPLAPRLFDRLEAHLQVPVIEGYGMTEAYWICSNRLPGSGYSRKPGSVGPPAGPEVAVLGPHGSPQPRGLRGEVVIRGANVTAGYESAGQTGWIFDGRGERWFSTGDEGYLDPDGYLVARA